MNRIVFVHFIAIIFSCVFSNENLGFEKMLWHRNPDFRYLMIDNLEQSKILDGKNIKYIDDLLGKPLRQNVSFQAYGLGRPKGKIKPSDPMYFILEFNQEKTVIHYYLNTEPVKKSSRSLTLDKK